MPTFSKISLGLFELLNEVFIAFGSGLAGLGVLVNYQLSSRSCTRALVATSLCFGGFLYIYNASIPHMGKHRVDKKKVVLITGCDSGLGYSLTRHISELGFTVISGFLNIKSPGAIDIHEKLGKNVIRLPLDITVTESMLEFLQGVDRFFYENPDHELYAVINNAGVMVFGEFEWLTDNMIAKQLDVNLFGTMRFCKAFIPLLRLYKGRLINIISHCSQSCLPGLAAYGASKAGVAAFSDGLRVELAKFHVPVIKIIPGSFITSSNLLSNHADHVQEMFDNFTEEQHNIYDDYFERYNAYLLPLSKTLEPQMINDPELYPLINDALLNPNPKALYKTEPFRYKYYHFLFNILPTYWRDKLILKFMQMPEYKVNDVYL